MPSSISELTVDDLDAPARKKVMFGLIWRLVVVLLTAYLVGIVVGFVTAGMFDFFSALLTGELFPRNLLYIRTSFIFTSGLVIDLVFVWQYFKWVFRVRLGDYRLRLVSDRGQRGAA